MADSAPNHPTDGMHNWHMESEQPTCGAACAASGIQVGGADLDGSSRCSCL